MLGSLLGTVGAAGVMGGFGYLGARETNDTNADIASARNAMEVEEAQKNRDFQAGETAINREYQERMSSSAVQRRMDDMKQAGINPILAGKYDASAPAGNIAAGSKANAHGYTAINEIQPFLDNLSTAIDLKKRYHEANTAENTENITEFPSGISQDAEKGWSWTKDKMEQLGVGTAKAKIRLDQYIDQASQKLDKGTSAVTSAYRDTKKSIGKKLSGVKKSWKSRMTFQGYDKNGKPIYKRKN